MRNLALITAAAGVALAPIAASAQTARAILQADRAQGTQADPQPVALQSSLSNARGDFGHGYRFNL